MSEDTKGSEIFDERECEEGRHSKSHQHGKKRHYDIESDRDWLDRDKDANVYRDSTRKSSNSRHSRRSLSHDYRETLRDRILDTVFDADLSDMKAHRERHLEHREKIFGKHKVSSGTANSSDYNKDESTSTGSSRDLSQENRDSASSEERLHRRRRIYDSDCTGDWSDGMIESRHGHTRKSLTRVDEGAGLSNDHWESGKSLHDKYHQKGSERAKSSPHKCQKQTSSGKRDRSNRKTKKVSHPDERDEYIDTRGRWEPEKGDTREHHKHKRKSHEESASHDKIYKEYFSESRLRTRK